jgi:hypothetical protein
LKALGGCVRTNLALRHPPLRRVLIAERDAGRRDDEIMREVLEDIDLEEAVLASRSDRI